MEIKNQVNFRLKIYVCAEKMREIRLETLNRLISELIFNFSIINKYIHKCTINYFKKIRFNMLYIVFKNKVFLSNLDVLILIRS